MTRSGGEPNMADTATSRSAPRSIARTNELDRKSTRLNSSHANISYAVFCLKKKKHNDTHHKSVQSDITLRIGEMDNLEQHSTHSDQHVGVGRNDSICDVIDYLNTHVVDYSC